METFGMVWLIDGEGPEVVITREAMDVLAGVAGVSEERLVELRSDDLDRFAHEAMSYGFCGADGRFEVTRRWIQDMEPWPGAPGEPNAGTEGDAWGRT